LQEKLRITDSIAHFDKAISLDPNFALAHLNRANVSPTGKEFFEHLKHAVALSDKASDGERMLIQSADHYKKATVLAPDNSTAFNILVYAYRQNEAYSDAENAFKKYIQLIPND